MKIKIPKRFPIMPINEKLGKFINAQDGMTAWQQRLILGASALPTQPVIDYFNPDVDEKTRKISTCRTVVKIVVGTTVGVIVRHRILNFLEKNPYMKKKIAKYFDDAIKAVKENLKYTPGQKAISENVKKQGLEETKKEFNNKLASALGILASLFTNFAIDMPLSKLGTNWLLAKTGLKHSEASTNES